MARIYIPVDTKQEAETVINKIYELISPPSERQPDWQTLTLGSVYQVEVNGEMKYFVDFPDDYFCNLHPRANPDVVDEILNPFINKGMATATEKANVKAQVHEIITNENMSKKVRAYGLLEGLNHVKNNAKTEAEMIQLGLIKTETI